MASRRRPLGDDTIPRRSSPSGNAKQRGAATSANGAILVDRGAGDVHVVSRRTGAPIPAAWASVQQGTQFNTIEGFYRAPRPWTFDAGVTPTVAGDNFLVVYHDADPMKPVLLGGFRPLDVADPEFFPPPIGADPNPIRGRWAHMTAAGITGHVQLRALETGGDLELVVGGGSFGTGLRIAFDFSAGTIKVGKGAETECVPLGNTLLQGILDALNEVVIAVGTIPYVPATPPAPGLLQTIADLTASLAAGAPYLSSTVKVQ